MSDVRYERIYLCDRCKTKITITNKYGISVSKGRGVSKKTWDLCGKCFRALERGIAKGVNK